jgi:hypothetical protein
MQKKSGGFLGIGAKPVSKLTNVKPNLKEDDARYRAIAQGVIEWLKGQGEANPEAPGGVSFEDYIVGLLGKGTPLEDIVAGIRINRSTAPVK